MNFENHERGRSINQASRQLLGTFRPGDRNHQAEHLQEFAGNIHIPVLILRDFHAYPAYLRTHKRCIRRTFPRISGVLLRINGVSSARTPLIAKGFPNAL